MRLYGDICHDMTLVMHLSDRVPPSQELWICAGEQDGLPSLASHFSGLLVHFNRCGAGPWPSIGPGFPICKDSLPSTGSVAAPAWLCCLPRYCKLQPAGQVPSPSHVMKPACSLNQAKFCTSVPETPVLTALLFEAYFKVVLGLGKAFDPPQLLMAVSRPSRLKMWTPIS